MSAFSNRALTFDDLLQLQDGEGQFQQGGVAINKEAEGSYQLDPRYAAQLRAAMIAPPAVQSPREQMVHGGKFFAGAAPFGFAGPGSLNFDPSTDSAAMLATKPSGAAKNKNTMSQAMSHCFARSLVRDNAVVMVRSIIEAAAYADINVVFGTSGCKPAPERDSPAP